MKKKTKTNLTVKLIILLVPILIFTGCMTEDTKLSEHRNEITVALSSDTGSLDPAGSIALTYLAYSSSALDELLTFDQNGNIEYRGAVSYEVNENSTEFTFKLRQESKWSDGTAVTAEDYLNTIKRALVPRSGSGYANYLFPIKNAEDIYNGTKDISSLGVSTPDEYTLVFTLEDPCVYFLDLLRLPVYMPSCSKYADSSDSGWDKDTERSVSNGPFYLERYTPGQSFVLKKNVMYWNADSIKLNRITYRFFDSQLAMTAAYETGEIDIASGVHSSVLESYSDSPDLSVTDLIATRYIYPNLNVEPLDDVRVRKALSMAIDRKDLCDIIGGDTEPTLNLVAKYLRNKNDGSYFVDGAEPPFEEDVKQARKLLDEAGFPGGDGFPEVTYYYPSIEMDSDTAQVLEQQWKKNLNIDVELRPQELQVNYSTRMSGEYDLCRMNWTADFADPYSYLSMLLSNSPYNSSGIKDPEYDKMISMTGSIDNQTERYRLLHEAEKMAVGKKAYVIPLYSIKSCNLIRPDIGGIGQTAASGALEYRYAYIKN